MHVADNPACGIAGKRGGAVIKHILPCTGPAAAIANVRAVELPNAVELFIQGMKGHGFIVNAHDYGGAVVESVHVCELGRNAVLMSNVRAHDDVVIVVPGSYDRATYIMAVDEVVEAMSYELSALAVNLYPSIVAVPGPKGDGYHGLTPVELDAYEDIIAKLARQAVSAVRLSR